MKKTLHTSLLIIFTCLFFHSQAQQLLYQNNTLGTRIYNPGFGVNDTPNIIFDDINFPSPITNSFDSVVISQVTIAIGRAPGSPATIVNVFAAQPDTNFNGLTTLPLTPPKLIGTLNLPANGNSGFFIIGDNSTPLAAFKIDTGRFISGYQTLYIGLSFSDSVQSRIGWYLSNGPDSNYDLIYKYDVTSNDSVKSLNLSGTYNLPATFYTVVSGAFKNAVVLPVTMTNFEVSAQKSNNLIQWQTQTENNTDYFSIQRSNDGHSFKNIGQVAAAGFSSKTVNYQFADESPLSGINYYRIRSVDRDNTSMYSVIKSIVTQLSKSLSTYPNPAVTNNFKVDFTANNAGTATLQITNAKGQKVYSKQLTVISGKNSVQITDARLTSGTYFISIKNGEISYIGKLEKQ